MCFIIWDKMFGTYQAELKEEPVRYGLVTKKDISGPMKVIFHEFIAIWQDFFVKHRSLPLSIKLKYIFAPPGWSHDGSTQTADELREIAGLK